jgi:hypothetical protein
VFSLAYPERNAHVTCKNTFMLDGNTDIFEVQEHTVMNLIKIFLFRLPQWIRDTWIPVEKVRVLLFSYCDGYDMFSGVCGSA